MTAYLAIASGILLLLSALTLTRPYIDALKHMPPQFSDPYTSRYYMQYALFDPLIPRAIRRWFAISTALALAAFGGFAAVAYLSGNSIIAVLLLLICCYAVANVFLQWRRARGGS